MSKSLPPRFNEIVCIGAGLSGIGLGIQLQRKFNFTDIHFYDRNAGPSGTWEANRYPGCACDIVAHYYSFSFEAKPDWSSLFPSNTEIRQYIDGLIEKYNLHQRMTFRTECQSARWDDVRKIWSVSLRDIESGQTYTHECRMLFGAVGVLVNPSYPQIPGLDRFSGPVIHTARWPEDLDLSGKNIVILGTGSSGTQAIPYLVSKAKLLTQIIRTSHWILPRKDFIISSKVQWAFSHIPFLLKLFRTWIFCVAENNWRMFSMDKSGARQRKFWEAESRKFVQTVAPKKYHKMLIPDWPISCKRRVFDKDHLYLKSMHATNFELSNAPIVEVVPDGVKTTEKTHPADVIVLATGFNTTTSLGSIRIEGRNGLLLSDHWKELGGPGAYNNTAIHGFPNLMLIFGPNSTTGHNSVLFTIESHLRYSMKIMEPVIKGEALTYEVEDRAEREYVKSVQEASRDKVWNTCHNWYITDGWNATLYPWTQLRFWWKSHFPVWKHWSYTRTQPQIKLQRQKRNKQLLLYILIVLTTPAFSLGYLNGFTSYLRNTLNRIQLV